MQQLLVSCVHMPRELANFTRRFQVWEYKVSHGQLLLRSVKGDGLPTRVDVLFKSVAAVHLPTAFDGLSVSETSEGEDTNLHLLPGLQQKHGKKTFIVRGSQFTGYVIAGAFAFHEDELEYYDPSHFTSINIGGHITK